MAVTLAWLRPVWLASAVRDWGPLARNPCRIKPRFCRRTLSLSLTERAKRPGPPPLLSINSIPCDVLQRGNNFESRN